MEKKIFGRLEEHEKVEYRVTYKSKNQKITIYNTQC